jgi:Spy/CpxP family protein refolding chaperone
MAFPWKVVAAAAVIFVAGVVSGSVATRIYDARTKRAFRPPMPGGPPSPWVGQRMDFLKFMGDRLGLSQEQREQIDRLIKESQQRTRELWEPVAPKLQEEMRRLKEAVDAVLTPEQRAKAEELHKQRFSRPPGERGERPGRWGDGQGPRRRPPGAPQDGGGPPPGPPQEGPGGGQSTPPPDPPPGEAP